MLTYALIISIVSIIFWCFIGFATGRYGDKWGGHLNTPDHWIRGLVAVALGIFYFEVYALEVIAFGFGHFVSDLDDFLNLKFYGPDKPHKWKFWSTK